LRFLLSICFIAQYSQLQADHVFNPAGQRQSRLDPLLHKDIEEGLEKLENKKLASQRFVPTQEKIENQSKLALGAKLDRALGRRLGGQDAVMRDRKKTINNEKMLSSEASEKMVAAA
jgi:hypothetical protein